MPEVKINGIALEICAGNPTSARIAQENGATRIELCQNLYNGGLTPSYGQIELVRSHIDIGLHVLIRPRQGDFVYSEWEIQEMISDINFCKQAGVDGVVIGVLDEKGDVPFTQLERLVQAALPMHITFHRAFDKCRQPFVVLEQLKAMGFNRILTSGQADTALEGKDCLKQLVEVAAQQITIMPGSGITDQNIQEILQFTKADAVHCSAKETILAKGKYEFNKVTGMDENYFQTSGDEVQKIVEKIKAL